MESTLVLGTILKAQTKLLSNLTATYSGKRQKKVEIRRHSHL
jgi:hypothetical protein